MPFIAVMKANRDAMSDEKRDVLKRITVLDNLGAYPAHPIYTDGQSAIQWYVFDDPRPTLEDTARGAVVCKFLNLLSIDPKGKAKGIVRNEVDLFVMERRGFEVPEIPEGKDPYTYTWEHNNGPNWVQVFQSRPEKWMPVERG